MSNQAQLDKREQVDSATVGRQAKLVLTAVPAGANPDWVGTNLLGKSLTVAGDYYCDIDVRGMDEVECHLMGNALVGTVAVAFTSTRFDGTSHRSASTPAGGNFVNDTNQALVITSLRGVGICRVKIAVSAASRYDFVYAAEYNGH